MDIKKIYSDCYENFIVENAVYATTESNVIKRLLPRSSDSINKWKYQGQMADLQEMIFSKIVDEIDFKVNSKLDQFEIHFAYIKRAIVDFEYYIQTEEIENLIGYVTEIDMSKINNQSEKSINNYIVETKEIISKNIPKCLLEEINKKKNLEYLYVILRHDGMVVTVGKSTFKNFIEQENSEGGDLFDRLDVRGMSGSANIIIRKEFGNQLIEKMDSLLKTYYRKAWLIPIYKGNVYNLEEKLGKYLQGENGCENGHRIPILNKYSHVKK